MDFTKLDNDLKEMRKRNRGLALAVGGLTTAVIICLVNVLNLIGKERTIVVPPSIDKTFWVTKDHASR